QRQLAVGGGLFGKVVINAQRVPTLLVHVKFGHGAAGVRGNVLQRCRVGGGSDHHDRVIHSTVGAQAFDHRGYGRFLLPDGDIDADDVLFTLVDNRIDGDGRLAGLAVAD